ncbi:MAG: hypothetical protein ACOYON_14185 [Fimbriimonas sp.]
MARMTARQKFDNAGPAKVHPLDPAKAARLGGATMLIPSPQNLVDAINAIPSGTTVPIRELRDRMAKAAGAECTCPMVAGIYWRIIAELSEEGELPTTPWWRVTLDGKPNPKLPGGIQRHRELILAEQPTPAI